MRSAVISVCSDRWGCKQRCQVTQWPGEVLSLQRKKVCLLTSELSTAWYHARQSYFSRRGYSCSWEDFVSKSQSCCHAIVSIWLTGTFSNHTKLSTLNPDLEKVLLEVDHCCRLFLSLSLFYTHSHSHSAQAAGFLSSTCDSQGLSAEHQVSVETQRHLVTARQLLYCNFIST